MHFDIDFIYLLKLFLIIEKSRLLTETLSSISRPSRSRSSTTGEARASTSSSLPDLVSATA